MIEHCKVGLHMRLDMTCIECGDTATVFQDRKNLEAVEPPPASIVMTEGETGTAWQRFGSDGLWHGAHGKVTSWDRLLKRYMAAKPVRIVYLPPLTPTR